MLIVEFTVRVPTITVESSPSSPPAVGGPDLPIRLPIPLPGQRRIVVRELVGGLALKEEEINNISRPLRHPPLPSSSTSHNQPTQSLNNSTSNSNNAADSVGSGDIWEWRDTDGGKASKPAHMGGNRVSPQQAMGPSNLFSPPLSSTQHDRASSTPSHTIDGSNMGGVGTIRFPPDGGVGLRVLARWGYFPSQGAIGSTANGNVNRDRVEEDTSDELMFPRGAEIREVEDINGTWYWGVYAGDKGVFPANYVRVL